MQIQTLGRCLKEQLTNGLDDDGMMVEIIWEITSVVETSLVTSVQVLALARRVEAQMIQTTMLDSLKEPRDFDAIRSEKRDQK